MFDRLKKSLENLITDTVENLAETATSSTPSAVVQAPATSMPTIADEPIERVSKATPVYEPLTSFATDDIPQLLEALDDPDPKQQVHAIQLAHHLMKQRPSQIYEISEVLIMVMQTDPDAPARAAAAEALNVIKMPQYQTNLHQEAKIEQEMIFQRYNEVINALSQIMEEDEDLLTRQNAAESLALTGTDSKVRGLFQNLWRKRDGELDPFIRMVVSMHIGAKYIKHLQGAERKQLEDAIIQAYVDYPEMEGAVRVTIQDANLARAIPYLMKTYQNNEDLRVSIIGSLGFLEHPNALKLLLHFMVEEDKRLSTQAIKSLSKLKDEDAIEPLNQYKATLPADDKRHHVIEQTLIECGDVGSIEPYIANLSDADVSKQQMAILALGQIGNEAAIDALIDFMKTTKNKNLCWDVYRELLKYPSEKVAHAMIDRVCDGTLGYRQVSYNFVSTMRMTHAIRWLDKAVDERATPEAMVQIKKDKDILKRM